MKLPLIRILVENLSNLLKAVIFRPMQLLKHGIHIIRTPNLCLLAGIQCLIFLKLSNHTQSVMSWTDFILLIVITVLLGASGYVINDYYDAGTDRINKPDKWIAGNVWSMKTVRLFYLVLVITGFLLSIWLAIQLGMLAYIFIYPLAVSGLFIYSYKLKCRPVIGNLWVSIFCAGVIGIVYLPDYIYHNTQHIKTELWYYIAFAFLSTWLREVVKDIEDVAGDSEIGCRTAVVVYGVKTGKIIAVILGFLLLVSLLFWDVQETNNWIKIALTVMQGFTVGALAFVWWAKNKTYYHHASTIIKFLMVGGTLILFLL